MDKGLVTIQIEALEGVEKIHFLNHNAKRLNKSLGDLVGIKGFGFHVIEVPINSYSTEFHSHYYEDECVYVLEGTGLPTIGDKTYEIQAGDFIGYPASGEAHTILNNGVTILKMIVVGSRLPHDVTNYPNLKKRLYRNQGQAWSLIDLGNIISPK